MVGAALMHVPHPHPGRDRSGEGGAVNETAVLITSCAGLFLIGAPCRAENIGILSRRDAVLAVNHSSYADALVLAAAIPGEPLYAAKREFADQMFAGPFLRRLGVIFVERRDIAASVADQSGHSAKCKST